MSLPDHAPQNGYELGAWIVAGIVIIAIYYFLYRD